MDTIAQLIMILRTLIIIFGPIDFEFIKSDFTAAYRSCPIHPDHYAFTDILVTHPELASIWVSAQKAMPFGAIAAVYAWDRLGAALTHILSNNLSIPLCRYVDDLFTVLPASLAKASRQAILETIDKFGFQLDPEKTPIPSSNMIILGVDITYWVDQSGIPYVTLRIDRAKRAIWIQTLETAEKSRKLSKHLAEKLAGRLEFASSAILGRWVRHRITHIYKHVYSKSSDLSPAAIAEIKWWKQKLSPEVDLCRTIKLIPDSEDPWIIYTDAHGKGGIGAILCTSVNPKVIAWFGTSCPRSLTESFKDRKTQITMFEAIAVPLAIDHWHRLLSGRRVIFFVDNQSALGALRHGSSSSWDLNEWVGITHSFIHQRQIQAFWHWVPSAYNLADPPSRNRPPSVAAGIPEQVSWQTLISISPTSGVKEGTDGTSQTDPDTSSHQHETSTRSIRDHSTQWHRGHIISNYPISLALIEQ